MFSKIFRGGVAVFLLSVLTSLSTYAQEGETKRNPNVISCVLNEAFLVVNKKEGVLLKEGFRTHEIEIDTSDLSLAKGDTAYAKEIVGTLVSGARARFEFRVNDASKLLELNTIYMWVRNAKTESTMLPLDQSGRVHGRAFVQVSEESGNENSTYTSYGWCMHAKQ